MSTLSGQASKGEKTKSKFQSLDINNLYRVSRGENTEKTQQKSSSVYIKHGMQSLGKVPSARRAPANLPSLKSEHSETGAAVPLVPPGGPGWGKQDSTSSNSSANNSTASNQPATQQGNAAAPQNSLQQSSHQAAIAIPVTTTIPPHNKPPSLSSASPATSDKLWSSITSGSDPLHPPPYQSPQFQHEFPSLSAGDGGPTRTGSDAQYPSGLSLRPQTEGSWTQGGTRPGGSDGPPRPGSGPMGAPPQLSAPAGPPQHPLPPQFRTVMPPFMYKGSFPQGGTGIQSQNTPPQPGNGRNRPDNRPPRLADSVDEVPLRPIIKEEELNRLDEIGNDMGWAIQDEIDYNQKLAFSDDECESSSRRDNRDSRDREGRESRERDSRDKQGVREPRERDLERSDSHSSDGNRNWNNNRSSNSRGRSSEEDDIRMQRRTQQEVELAVQRAKQRKEEEEKRFNEATKQGAAKKLMELEEKIHKRDRVNEGTGTINPLAVPPKAINHAPIPLPEFQKEKERDNRSATPNDVGDDKVSNTGSNRNENNFRHLTQIEGKNFPRKHQGKQSENRERDRGERGDARQQNGLFSRQFQNDLPPRFKHQRNNSNSNLQPQQPQQPPLQQQQQHFGQFDNSRWAQGGNVPPSSNVNRNVRDSPERNREEDERRDYKRQGSEESYRSAHSHSQLDISQKQPPQPLDNRYSEENQDSRHHGYDYGRGRDRDEEKWQKGKERERPEKKDEYPTEHLPRDDWHDRRDSKRDDKPQERYDRPQRPDSRNSRSTRESRHSREPEPRDYLSWVDPAYEDKRKDHVREDRRVVPGPITKDRIEADDLRNEKRHLTQLKRGQIIEKKPSDLGKREDKGHEELDCKKNKDVIDSGMTNAWADSIPTTEDSIDPKFLEDKSNKTSSNTDLHKADKHFGQDIKKSDKNERDLEYKDRQSRNSRVSHSQNKSGWGGSNDFMTSSHHHRPTAWSKRPPGRSHKGAGGQRPSSQVSGDFHGTDSEGSIDDHSDKVKKFEKDEKNREVKQEKLGERKSDSKYEKRENYVPRGEPSRLGRGGGTFGRNSRLGGLSKKIDGYGPPPKSPFGHHDDKEKKASSDEASMEQPHIEDRTKLSQQALSAGIIGSIRKEHAYDDKHKSRKDHRRGKSRSKNDGSKKEELYDTNSEHSDEKDGKSGITKPISKTISAVPRGPSTNAGRRINPPPRMGGEKRYADNPVPRQNSNTSLQGKKDDKNEQNVLCNAIADISLKSRENEVSEDKEEKSSLNGGDSEGFQEVKSKKAVKERQKSVEDKTKGFKIEKEKDIRGERKKPQLTPQQIQSIPSLMATPVNPPQSLPKNQFERPRQQKLAPRFAKQKLQKAQMQQQQQHHIHDVGDMNKVNQNINVYGMKDPSVVAPVSAWDKPLGSQIRSMDHENIIGVAIDNCKGLEPGQVPPQGSSPNTDKMMSKSQLQDKTLLDGSTPPVNTIIFENTNFKSAPGSRNSRSDKPRKMDDGNMDTSVIGNFNKPLTELIGKDKSDSIQLPISFKEDTADMKLDFFDSDLSNLTDEKSSKTLMMSKTMHTITTGNSTMCTADSLNIKIASVKKVWETPSEHSVVQDDGSASFSNSFVSDNNLDPNVFNKSGDNADDSHEGYNQSPNQAASATTNVCKVKPTQQVSGGGNQAVLNSASHQQHSAIVAQSLMGNPLSPPPLQHVPGAGVGLGQPQQYGANQHIGYQAGLGGSTQYGMSAIPSPPTVPVLYNSQQPLQAANAAGLYGTFQMDQASVLGGQGRSQYSQYPAFGLGQTASSPYSTQSVYLQTAQPHPPPTAQAPPDIYQNFRLSATAPFGQNQQLNNPSTVLISSTSNTLMSASVKPSTQQISAIGTKAGGVGQAYQQQSQQGQQVYMYDPTMQANYMSNLQRGPGGPVQNNVVPTLQPSSSYYSGSTGGQTGFFQQPGSSSMPSAAQLQQHQNAGYGLQGFAAHNQTHSSVGFNSQFLSTPMQVAAALSQQYRSAAGYMKGVAGQQMTDQSGRPQQLKSPGNQESLSSVFSGSQIPSPKSRQPCKHPPPQSSPTAQPKYLYQNVGNQQSNVQRYPTPIQRPVNFQQNLGSVQNNVNQKHRSSNVGNKAPNRQFYGGQNNSISSQNEKVDDSKLNDNSGLNNTNTSSNSNSSKVASAAVNSSSDIKDTIKEEASALKD